MILRSLEKKAASISINNAFAYPGIISPGKGKFVAAKTGAATNRSAA